jgi:hypothetical protein
MREAVPGDGEREEVPAAAAPPSLRRPVAWFLGHLVLAWISLLPLSLSPGSRLADDGDAPQGAWILWWSASHLTSPASLLDANVYYPHPRGLLYSEPLLSQAALALPLQHALGEPVLVNNLLVLLTLAASGLAAQMLLRALGAGEWPAAVGAVAYVLNAYTFAQLPRLQLISLQWLPLALLALHRLCADGRRRHAWKLAAWSVLLGLACLYYLAFYALALLVLAPPLLLAARRRLSTRTLAHLAIAGLLAAAPLLAIAVPYARLYARYGFAGEGAGTEVLAFFLPSAPTLLYPIAPQALRSNSHFLSPLLLALALVGAVSSLRRARGASRLTLGAYLTMGALALALACGRDMVLAGEPLFPGPFRLLQLFSPFAKLRDPGRFTVLTVLAASVFAALGAERLLGALRPSRRIAAVAALAALLIAEQWSPGTTRGVEIPTGPRTPEVYRWLAAQPGSGPVAELPVLEWRFVRFTSLDALFSSGHGRPILFARPSFFPPALEYLAWLLRDFPDPAPVTVLRALRVELAVVHPARWESGGRRLRRRLERGDPALRLVHESAGSGDPATNHLQLGGERVYEVTPLAAEGSPLACSCREIERGGIRISGSGSGDPALAVDGRLETRWVSGDAQRAGDFLELRFDRPRRVARVEVAMTYPYGEFARALDFEGTNAGAVRPFVRRPDVWQDIALVRRLVESPVGARLRYDLEPQMVDALRLRIVDTESGLPPWSVPEIHVFEEDPVAPPSQ